MPLWSNLRYLVVKVCWKSCQISIYYEVKSTCFLNFYFCESMATINFPCSIFLAKNWSKWPHFLKNTTQIEITIITISVENCTNTGAKVFVLPCANCCTNCYHNFNPCAIFENMMSFTLILKEELEQGKLIVALNSQKFEILKFGKIPRKDLLCMTMQKELYWEFDHSCTSRYCYTHFTVHSVF